MPWRVLDRFRKAADELSITSTALNRRILSVEHELGVALFERLPRGVRLNTAGEIFINYARSQISDVERVKSQIADLRGVRRGHVAVACSQALLPYFLPEQIAHYRRDHPGVTFGVFLRDRAAAEQALTDHSADLALVFEPVKFGEFQTLLDTRQPVHAVMAADHPLADKPTVRLRDCLQYPHALPTAPYGVRYLLEAAVQRSSLTLQPVVQSDSFEFLRHYVASERLISFQIPIGLVEGQMAFDVVSRQVDERDVPVGHLCLGQLRGRALPVAAARFADQLASALAARFE